LRRYITLPFPPSPPTYPPQSKQLTSLKEEMTALRTKNQQIIEENNAYVESRTKNFGEFTLSHKKKLDGLVEEKEQLQIEVSGTFFHF
jgi:hypothetical protein